MNTVTWLKLVVTLGLLLATTEARGTALMESSTKAAGEPHATLSPGAYPTDPTADIAWNGGMNGVADIQGAFNYARTTENTQLGISLPALTLPSQAEWNGLSDNAKALWLINQERVARSVLPLGDVETNVTSVAQTYAQYLFEHNTFSHNADGRSPWERLAANPAIGACYDFLNVAENLAVFATSGTSIPLPIERSVYDWLYDDAGSSWGHRHAILWYPYADNSGPSGQEGFLGIGRINGGPYQGPFSQPWNYVEIVVMNVFDPCATWNYGTAAPTAPSNLTASAPTTTTLALTWMDNSATEDGFQLDRSADGSNGWAPIIDTAANVTIHTDTGLTCNTPYHYRVRAHNAAGNSAYSAVATGTTGACPIAPALALTKQATAVGGLSVVPLGGVVTYTLVLRNQGNAIANQVVMSDPLPSLVIFGNWIGYTGTLILPPLGVTLTNNTVVWQPGDVAAGEALTLTFTITVSSDEAAAGQTVRNTVTLSATNAAPATAGVTFTIKRDWYDLYLPLIAHRWPPVYTISGKVTDNHGAGLAEVTMSAGAGYATATDSNGNYTLTQLLGGAYSLTPSKEWYAFAPSVTSVTLPPEAVAVNFVGASTVPLSLKNLVTQATIPLPQPLAGMQSSWCTWEWCSISPRLYHAPLNDGRTWVGWTDNSGNGHVSLIGTSATLEQTYDFAARSLRGLVAHEDGTFAILLWEASAKIMWLAKYTLTGSEVWRTNIDGALSSFNPGIGDSRLTYGNGLYAAYFAVHGDSGWPAGHEGDQLTYVNSAGIIQSGGWEWGCSHSMAELISYHPTLTKFAPICASDCYAQKGILSNDNQVVYSGDGNCGGLTAAQLGQVALSSDTWKLVFNGLNRPGYVGQGIGLATLNGSFQSSYLWLTNTDGQYERDPALARLGVSLASNRYLVGWTTTNDAAYWLGVIDDAGSFIAGPEEVSSVGVSWGNRDDSFHTRADGRVSWIQGAPNSASLHYFQFDSAAYLP